MRKIVAVSKVRNAAGQVVARIHTVYESPDRWGTERWDTVVATDEDVIFFTAWTVDLAIMQHAAIGEGLKPTDGHVEMAVGTTREQR